MFIELLKQCVSFFSINIANILYVCTNRLVESLTWLEIRSSSLVHRDIQEMPSRVDSRVNPACLFIYVAFYRTSFLEWCAFKLADMENHIIFSHQILESELCLPLQEVALVIWLTTALRMADSLIENNSHLAIFRVWSLDDAENFISLGCESI